MPIAKEKLEQILRKAFPNAELEIVDMAGDQDHYSIKIVDESFIGKTLINQHKMVNEALKAELVSTLHAMQLKTSAPLKL